MRQFYTRDSAHDGVRARTCSELFTRLYYRAAVAMRLLLTIASSWLIAGCAQAPAFRASLPSEIDQRDKAIAIIGDLQQTSGFVRAVRRREDNAQAQQRLISDLQRHADQLAALVIVGDLVYTARSKRDWAHFDSLIAPFAERMPILPAIGNHDYPCFLVQLCRNGRLAHGMAERFPWISPGQPFSTSAGRIRLLFLDSESQLETQSAWLRRQLEDAAGQFRAALVFYHRPAFSNSIDRGADGNEAVQRYVVPILNESPLPTIAISGHIHGFEHFIRDGVHHITTAGGGGPRGPMPTGPRADAYRGPDCISEAGEVLRPFNYLLLRETAQAVHIEVRGFCGGDSDVRLLDAIEVEL